MNCFPCLCVCVYMQVAPTSVCRVVTVGTPLTWSNGLPPTRSALQAVAAPVWRPVAGHDNGHLENFIIFFRTILELLIIISDLVFF